MPTFPKKKNISKASKKSLDFENAFNELEKTIEILESGKLNLEDSVKKFETGMDLIRTCQKNLSQAEKKVRVLLEKHDTEKLIDLEEIDNNNDELS